MSFSYVSFTDFLWGFTFIGPFSYLLWKYRTIILRIRQFLWKRDLMKPMDCDYEELCATLLLEQTQAIHYCARTEEGSALGNIAGFFFSNFPYVDNDCNYQVADLFAVDIDLDSKRFVKAKLDDLSLNAKETLILLWFVFYYSTKYSVSLVVNIVCVKVRETHHRHLASLPSSVHLGSIRSQLSTSNFMLWRTGESMWMKLWPM